MKWYLCRHCLYCCSSVIVDCVLPLAQTLIYAHTLTSTTTSLPAVFLPCPWSGTHGGILLPLYRLRRRIMISFKLQAVLLLEEIVEDSTPQASSLQLTPFSCHTCGPSCYMPTYPPSYLACYKWLSTILCSHMNNDFSGVVIRFPYPSSSISAAT